MMMLLMLLGLLTFIVGGFMLLIAAFTVSIWWGIFCILFPPTTLLFVLLNWAKAKRALGVQVVGIALMILAGVMVDGFFSALRDHPFSVYKQYSWSSTRTVTLPPGIHQCIDKDGSVIYSNQDCKSGEAAVITPQAIENLPVLPEEKNFSCDGRTRCNQMTSCEEATFFINHCPNTEMDGNKDGVPCESQWCGN